jgi:hypothetical protein
MPRCPVCAKFCQTKRGVGQHLKNSKKKSVCQRYYELLVLTGQDLDHLPDLSLAQLEALALAGQDEARIQADGRGDYFGDFQDYSEEDWGGSVDVGSDNIPPSPYPSSIIDEPPPSPMSSEPLNTQPPSPISSEPPLDPLSPHRCPTPPPPPPPHTLDPSSSDSDPHSDTASDIDEAEELEHAAAALDCEDGWEPAPIAFPLEPPPQASSRFSSQPPPPRLPEGSDRSPSPPPVFTPSPLSSTPSSSGASDRSSSPSNILPSEPEDGDSAHRTPWARLTRTTPYVVKYPDPRAGAPLEGDNEEPTNSTYQSRLGEDQAHNPYYPFKSKLDWLIARWGKLRGSSSTALTELLQIPEVCLPFIFFACIYRMSL